MKNYAEAIKSQHNELNKRADSTRGAFTMDVDELPKEKHQKFAQLHDIKGKATIMGEKI